MPRAACLLLRALALLCVCGCGPRVIEEPVYSSERVRVLLRRTEEKGAPVPRSYEHPAIIADVRLAHILALLAYESGEGKRSPVIRSEDVYDLAEGMARAFERAGADDEVAAAAFAQSRRLGIFTEDRVTSFRSFLRGGQLLLEFYAVEQALEEPGVARERQSYGIPIEVPQRHPAFRLLAAEGMALEGPRTVAVDWRDPRFRRGVSLSVRPSGVRRRTVLMEAADEEPPAPAPEDLSDAQLRALDQLEAARRSGILTESEFQRRRRLLLEGTPPEGGSGGAP